VGASTVRRLVGPPSFERLRRLLPAARRHAIAGSEQGYTVHLEYPPTAELRPRYGHGRPSHGRLSALLDASRNRYESTLRSFEPFFDDLYRVPRHGIDRAEPCWLNEWLIGLDTVSLYGFVRKRRPARYVEIGSGQSTKLVAQARADGGLATQITSIDPAPRAEVDQLCDRIVRMPLEQVDLAACFGGLEAGDIVFLDGSHRVLPNSDCVAFFLDVLPSLPPGVLVGIHDIYLPEDYPEGFIDAWWSEQYALAALLLGEPGWLQVVLPTFYVSGIAELAAIVAPLFDRPGLAELNRRGSAFWLETTPAG